MAKGKGKDQLYREDLMIYTVSNGSEQVHYLIEREPYEKEGLKKSVFVYGRTGYDAVFKSREAAEHALNQYPSRPVEEEAPAEQPAAGQEAPTEAPAEAPAN